MKDQEGRYHAFFTGHNDYYAPAEAIMHAEGTDLTTWTKIKEDTFTDENYSTNDFRDPYVFYVPEENCYWMLVVTRKDGNGVIEITDVTCLQMYLAGYETALANHNT